MPTGRATNGLRDIHGTDAARERPGRVVQEMFELADAGEEWGLDVVWLAEMLINPARSVLSAPPSGGELDRRPDAPRCAWGRPCSSCPWTTPLRVAARSRTLDHLSQGRFDFGIGRSGAPAPTTRSASRTRRARRDSSRRSRSSSTAWKGEPFSYEGRFFRFSDLTVSPRPFSSPTRRSGWPRPPRTRFPRWPDGVADLRRVARHGHSGAGRPREPIARPGATAGHPGRAACVSASRSTPPRPRRRPGRSPRDDHLLLPASGRHHARAARARRHRAGSSAGRRPSALRRSRTTRSSSRKVAFGTGPALIDRFGQLREELVLTGVAAELNPGGLLPTAQEQRSLEILTQQVMPAFK